MFKQVPTLKLAVSLVGLMALSNPAESAEVVLDFEDAVTTSSYDAIPSGYAGLTWGSDAYVINGTSSGSHAGTGYEYGTSGDYSIFNWYSRNITIAFPSAVDVDGAYFTNAWEATNTITVTGYLNGVELYTTTVSPNSTTSQAWFSLAFEGVDELLMTPSLYEGSGHFVVDDFTYYTDDDSDGYFSDDCDDTDATVNPGASEYCDGVDNNCDGSTDEATAVDAITWYADADSDGYGDATSTELDCYQPSGYSADDTDCDDTDAAINMGATEIWYDGVDQNCDAWSDYDQDADGFEHLDYDANGDGIFGTDCNDEDADINTDATEIWYDDVDQDCDGLSDFDADYDGQDSESYGGEDCDDADPDVYTGAPDTPYDGIVTDCLNADDYDADGDGSVSIDHGGDDCDDANSDVYPAAEEVWYDGIDQDCDGNDDDQDVDGYALNDDCDDEDADVNPAAEEVWYDGIDQDCDGNDDDQDVDGYALNDDCDDEDAESFPENGTLDADCEPIGGGDTGEEGGEKSGCFSSTTGGKPTGVWALLLAGALLLRRKSQQG